MPIDSHSQRETNIAVHRQSDEDEVMRRLKLVTEIRRKEPFPNEAVINWAEGILLVVVSLFWLFCFAVLAVWFLGLNT